MKAEPVTSARAAGKLSAPIVSAISSKLTLNTSWKGGAFQQRQALKRHHQRQRDIVNLILHLLDDRFRQLGSEVGLAPVPGGFRVVEAKARHDAAQKSFRLAHSATVKNREMPVQRPIAASRSPAHRY